MSARKTSPKRSPKIILTRRSPKKTGCKTLCRFCGHKNHDTEICNEPIFMEREVEKEKEVKKPKKVIDSYKIKTSYIPITQWQKSASTKSDFHIKNGHQYWTNRPIRENVIVGYEEVKKKIPDKYHIEYVPTIVKYKEKEEYVEPCQCTKCSCSVCYKKSEKEIEFQNKNQSTRNFYKELADTYGDYY